jgi:hypothetical protein
MREKIPYPIVKLDFHKARNTKAETYWQVIDPDGFAISFGHAEEMGYIKYLWTDKTAEKTRWYEYFAVLNPYIKLRRIRISNRGNISVSTYKPEQLEVKGIERDVVVSKTPYYFKTENKYDES